MTNRKTYGNFASALLKKVMPDDVTRKQQPLNKVATREIVPIEKTVAQEIFESMTTKGYIDL